MLLKIKGYFLSRAQARRRWGASALLMVLACGLSAPSAFAQPPNKLPSEWGPEDGFLAELTATQSQATQTDFPQLRDRTDPALQRSLEQGLELLRLNGAIRRKLLGVTVVDITDPENPRVASVNGDRHFYAASLPKIGILLGIMDAVYSGDVAWTPEIERQVTRMIRVSSNTAATQMYNLAGPRRIEALLTSPEYGFYDPTYNGGLWVGKPYGKGAAYKRDPMHNTSHGATALQVARFYYLMETGRLVSYHASQRMKAAMSEPGIRHKFVAGLAHYPNARIYRKSGSWRQYHADSAVVERGGRTYIAVGLAQDSAGGNWLKRIIGVMDTAVFDTIPVENEIVTPRDPVTVTAGAADTTLGEVIEAVIPGE